MISGIGTLNLDILTDRIALRELLLANSSTASLAEFINEYLRFFTAPEWRDVRSGGMLRGPGSASSHTIDSMLALTQTMLKLESCEGFDQVLSGLLNPPQVTSTIFEIEAAGWCAARKMHTNLVFSPPVKRGSSIKRPDFLWVTQQGELWCECKCARILATKAALRLQKLTQLAGEILRATDVRQGYRLEVSLPSYAFNGIEDRLRAAILLAADRIGNAEGPSAVGEATAIFREKHEVVQFPPESIYSVEMNVGPTPTSLDPRNAYLVVVMDNGKARGRLARALINDARTQLPVDLPVAIFLGGVGGTAVMDVALAEVASVSPVVWMWVAHKEGRIVWRQGQNFDSGLAE